jgi:hypothetical protein
VVPRENLVSAPSDIQKLDHVAVCLEPGDLADRVDFYLTGFGFERYSSEYIELVQRGHVLLAWSAVWNTPQ